MIVDFERFPVDEEKGFAPLIDGHGARGYYRIGYYFCAREAANSLIRGKGENQSAMPILFLYRHYLELALKDILNAAGAFDLKVSDRKFGHDLEAIWVEAQPLLKTFGVEASEPDNQVVREMVELDRRADAFRYAQNSKGERQFQGTGSVNLRVLIDVFEQLAGKFEQTINQIYEDEHDIDAEISRAVERDPY